MRSFKLIRLVDQTGTSGVGHVASGLVGFDGRCVVTWCVSARLGDGVHTKKINSATHYETWVDALLLHGHGGKTVLVWDDINVTVSDLDVLAKPDQFGVILQKIDKAA